MTRDFSNRIPVKQIKDCHTWEIPTIADDSKVVPCAEKEDRLKKEEEARRRTEIIGEEVDLPFGDEPLTAEQLRDIAETAQQEGYAEGFQRGFEEGKSTGYKEGFQKGLDESREEVELQQSRMLQLIENLVDPFHTQTNALEGILLETVSHLVRSIVQRELITDSGQIISFVQQAIAALPAGSENVQIYLNPDDLVLVENFKTARHNRWQLNPDPDLTPGGCRVETKQSAVDFSVEERLRVLFQRFVNGEFASAVVDEEVDREIDEEVEQDVDDSEFDPNQ